MLQPVEIRERRRPQLRRCFIRRGDSARAEEHARRAVDLADGVRAEQPADVYLVRVLCAALSDLADIQAGSGRVKEAKASRERVIALAAAAPYGRDPSISQSLARADVAIGRPQEAAPRETRNFHLMTTVVRGLQDRPGAVSADRQRGERCRNRESCC